MPPLTKSSNTSATKCDPSQLDQVVKWILAGQSEHDIAEAVRQSWPDAEARPLIVAAATHLSDAASFDVDVVFGWCFEATRDLYRRMVEIGDFTGALRAVKQLHDLSRDKPAS